MIKILTVTPFFPPDTGGLSEHVYSLNYNLVNLGHNIKVIAPKHIGDEIKENKKLEVIRTDCVYLPGWPYPTLRSMSIPIDIGTKIKSIMKKGDFDIVHVHGHHYPISWFAVNSAHKYGIPSVLTLHGMYSLNPNVLEGKSLIEDCLNKFVFAKIISKTNAVIGLTEKNINYAKKLGGTSVKYFTVSNGINVESYKENLKRKNEYRIKYGVGVNNIIILFSGRFEKVKGVLEFANGIKGIMKNKNVEAVIVGSGSLESEIKNILKNIERVHFVKWQPIETIHELYIASDIFVMPSKFEAQGITAIEAMNAGLHIVYSPVGGIPETISGYLRKTALKEITSDEIQKTLEEIIPNFPNGYDLEISLKYAEKFDWKKIASNISDIYMQLCKSYSVD